jgi:hypothetical protein
MTTTKLMELPTTAPAYLIAKVETAKATKALKAAQNRLAIMDSENERHGQEVAEKSRSGLPLRTNQQVLRYGSGSGLEIVYSACRCADRDVECLHNPRRTPHSPADLAAVQDAIEKATEAFSMAEETLDSTDPSFDAFANARDVGAKFCWWPMDRYVDPRLRRWRGQPISDEKVLEIGPHSLQHGIQVGGIIEVPS